MGKKKTLKHKKRTDMRRQESPSYPDSSVTPQHLHSYSFSPVTHHHTAPTSSPQVTVASDIRKTAFVCLLIIALQLILFFLLQNHILALPFVRY